VSSIPDNSPPRHPCADIIRFPSRAPFNVVIQREGVAWLVTARGHGWLHGSKNSALNDAHWLARNHGTRICEGDT
jgi:hypothetical protein